MCAYRARIGVCVWLLGLRLAPGAIYYVEPGGNDGDSGLSWELAKATPKAAVDAAIAAAGAGHEIVISNGTYTLAATIAITEKMTVRSHENNYNTVILDGQDARQCITISSAATGTLVSGLTLTNGYATGAWVYGGGISISGTTHDDTMISNCLLTCSVGQAGFGGGAAMESGMMADCIIVSNSAVTAGGGLSAYKEDAACRFRVIRCVFSNNAAPAGAGIYLRNLTYTNEVEDCVFVNNQGEGARLPGSKPTIFTRCNFIGNTTYGLNADSSGANLVITNCTFVLNTNQGATIQWPATAGKTARILDSTFTSNNLAGSTEGGGVSLSKIETYIERCNFFYNRATRGSGFRAAGNVTVLDSDFVGNEAATQTGGGIYTYVDDANTRTVLDGCTFTSNKAPTADMAGSAVYLQSGGATGTNQLTNCRFVANTGTTYTVAPANGFATIINGCDFLDNKGALTGIGEVNANRVVITNCTFVGNTGRGVTKVGAASSPWSVVQCTFASNRYASGGGAISMGHGMTADRCIVKHNYAGSHGGGVYFAAGGSTIRNSLIAGNESVQYGGGIYIYANTANNSIENCTIVGNKSQLSGGAGGLWLQDGGTIAAVTNSIILFNIDGGTYSNYWNHSGANRIAYSCTMPAPSGGLDGGGNTNVNPLFISAGSDHGTNHVMGDLQLQSGSPCKDKGTNMSWMADAVDLGGNPRITAMIVDMGAYESIVNIKPGTMFIFE